MVSVEGACSGRVGVWGSRTGAGGPVRGARWRSSRIVGSRSSTCRRAKSCVLGLHGPRLPSGDGWGLDGADTRRVLDARMLLLREFALLVRDAFTWFRDPVGDQSQPGDAATSNVGREPGPVVASSPRWERSLRRNQFYPARFAKAHGPLRSVVERVLRAFLTCGLVEHGFARLWCGTCRTSVLVPFSCRGRSFCPSCEKKKQLLWAEWLQKEVLEPVPHRHVVLTMPHLCVWAVSRLGVGVHGV
jgi:hypothetical protein